jgi:hypothetical protein
MTDTINVVAAAEQVPAEPATPVDQQQLAEQLVGQSPRTVETPLSWI